MLSLEDVNGILDLPLIGVIPESKSVLDASNEGLSVIHFENSTAAQAYKDLVDRFLGEDKPLRFIDPPPPPPPPPSPGFFQRLFGGR